MKSDRNSLLARLNTTAEEVDNRVLGVLADEQTEFIVREPDLGATVHQTLGVWRRRLRASKTSGNVLHGAETLVTRLTGMKAQQAKITQLDFHNELYSCVLFFERASDRFIGSVSSERHMEKSKKKMALAGQLAAPAVSASERNCREA